MSAIRGKSVDRSKPGSSISKAPPAYQKAMPAVDPEDQDIERLEKLLGIEKGT
jgi:hypothetical protein